MDRLFFSKELDRSFDLIVPLAFPGLSAYSPKDKHILRFFLELGLRHYYR